MDHRSKRDKQKPAACNHDGRTQRRGAPHNTNNSERNDKEIQRRSWTNLLIKGGLEPVEELVAGGTNDNNNKAGVRDADYRLKAQELAQKKNNSGRHVLTFPGGSRPFPREPPRSSRM